MSCFCWSCVCIASFNISLSQPFNGFDVQDVHLGNFLTLSPLATSLFSKHPSSRWHAFVCAMQMHHKNVRLLSVQLKIMSKQILTRTHYIDVMLVSVCNSSITNALQLCHALVIFLKYQKIYKLLVMLASFLGRLNTNTLL